MKVLLKALQDINGTNENPSFMSVGEDFEIQKRVSIEDDPFLVNRKGFFVGFGVFF